MAQFIPTENTVRRQRYLTLLRLEQRNYVFSIKAFIERPKFLKRFEIFVTPLKSAPFNID